MNLVLDAILHGRLARQLQASSHHWLTMPKVEDKHSKREAGNCISLELMTRLSTSYKLWSNPSFSQLLSIFLSHHTICSFHLQQSPNMKRQLLDMHVAPSSSWSTNDKPRNITITNSTGSTQSYALFADTPKITPGIPVISNNIILVLRGVASASGQAYFTLPKSPFYAVCGTSYGGESTVETKVEVLDSRPVEVGYKADDQTLVAGTTLELVIKRGTPNFANRPDIVPSGHEGCFCIRTSSEFTHSQARAGKSRSQPLTHPLRLD